MAKYLDEQVTAFRNRPLDAGPYAFIWVDALMATLSNLAIGALKALGATNIEKTTRALRDQPERALPILAITYKPDLNGT